MNESSVSAAAAAATPALADRLRGAIWGQFVGDAFCLGTHWIYDLDALARQFPNDVQGFEPPALGHYHAPKEPGQQTHYGDAALVLLEAVAACGRLDVADFGRRFVEHFGSADYTGYRDNTIRGTLKNFQAAADARPGEPFDFQRGADDAEPATAARLASVVVAHGALSDAELLALVASYTKVTQNNALAIAFLQADALALRDLLAGDAPRGAFARGAETIYLLNKKSREGKQVHELIAAALANVDRSVHYVTTELFGQACPLEHSFPAAVHCTLRHAASFSEAMRENARAGGDNAGRAAMIGGWLGAHLGVGAIPAAWRERLQARARIEAAVEKLVAATTSAAAHS
ncbi:MAG: ADP-ribosylglycohydrolase family protein [Verrucomicrobia bacterium]|nr:ADP-ribosylglycohydrolase family protein [Verrucomicrobiota bacterium]